MRCKKQFRFNKIDISNLLEVQLDPIIWNRIQITSGFYKCSFSWITRYCVFRLAMKKKISMSRAMEKLSMRLKKKQKLHKNQHRHIMCLYGDDEKLLRIVAMELGVTLSHLVRVALYWFLPEIEKGKVKWSKIFYHGTKICRYIDITRVQVKKIPWYDHIFYVKWPINAWWDRPMPIIPIPNTPDNKIDNIFKLLQPREKDPYVLSILKWFLGL